MGQTYAQKTSSLFWKGDNDGFRKDEVDSLLTQSVYDYIRNKVGQRGISTFLERITNDEMRDALSLRSIMAKLDSISRQIDDNVAANVHAFEETIRKIKEGQ